MEPDEILRRAWEAVQKAGLPESMQEAAFREAVALHREPGGTSAAPEQAKAPRQPKKKGRKDARAQGGPARPSEEEFFAELASESGVAEADLRDTLTLSGDGTVHVTPPTRSLGANRAEQARTVTALVASARRIGLNESPVDADAVRQEVQRKRCFDSANYASTVIGRLAGFNYGGSRAEIVTTSRWMKDFVAAVQRAHGRSADKED